MGQSQGIYNLPETLPDDLEKLRTMVSLLNDGAISATQLQAFRVPLGVYEQREDGTFMLRVRFPAGGVYPGQMRKLAAVSREFGNGILHVTTRQDIQVHSVPLDSIHPALVELAEADLSTKGGGGNTVRNVTACYSAGVCADEAFDVTPYSVALTEFLLPDPLSYQLPRKYKLCFSGCSKDCAGATVNDVGFIAKEQDGKQGFSVHVAGGMGAKSSVARPFEDFIPAGEIHLLAEAVKRVFDKNGNRKNKHKARLRFVMEKVGLEKFRELYEAELEEVRKEYPATIEVREVAHNEKALEGASSDAAESCGYNVHAQKQDGYFMVDIPLALGDISADTLEKLSDVVDAYGEGMLRTTQWQNIVLRWVRAEDIAPICEKLAELGLETCDAPVLDNMIACAGASTCRLGICLSRGLSTAIHDELVGNGLDLPALGDVKILISGCPNSCGRHPIASIGLFGAARRVGEKLSPHYVVQLGGKVEEGKTRLAKGMFTIPARNIPSFITDFLTLFTQSAEFPDFDAYLEAAGEANATKLTEKYSVVPSYDEDSSYYIDWSSDEPFSMAGRGPGECGVGVFDLIEVDLASARDALCTGRWSYAAALASRALLVTQGLEAKNDTEAFALFNKHFVEAGLVGGKAGEIVAQAFACADSQDPAAAFSADPTAVGVLVEAVTTLYNSMDASLRFKRVEGALEKPSVDEEKASEPPGGETGVDRAENFRGVACPLNYVKTKLILEQMQGGQVLSVLLDKPGADNVPGSVTKDGHTVVSLDRVDDHWRLVVRKADK